MLSIVISYSSKNHDFGDLLMELRQIPEAEIICVHNETYANRCEGFLRASYEKVLFLDADVIFNAKNFLLGCSEIFRDPKLLESQGKDQQSYAFTGACLNPRGASARLRAYNSICNSWLGLRLHQGFRGHLDKSQQVDRILGAAFLVSKKDIKEPTLAFPPLWGGEEVILADYLKRHSVQLIFTPALSVQHTGDLSFLSFCRRAFLQGRRLELQRISERAHSLSHLLLTADPLALAWIFLHYLCVCMGRIRRAMS